MTDIIWHQLPKDLSRLICAYVGTDRIKPWVKALGPISWTWLSENSSAMYLIQSNLDKIDWNQLSKNHAGIDLLEANKDKVNRCLIWSNPAIFEPRADHFTLLMQVKF